MITQLNYCYHNYSEYIGLGLSNLSQLATFLILILEVSGLTFGRGTNYPKDFRIFLQSLLEIAKLF
jgi:hypothetical protein